jgi:hypothetical protein
VGLGVTVALFATLDVPTTWIELAVIVVPPLAVNALLAVEFTWIEQLELKEEVPGASNAVEPLGSITQIQPPAAAAATTPLDALAATLPLAKPKALRKDSA